MRTDSKESRRVNSKRWVATAGRTAVGVTAAAEVPDQCRRVNGRAVQRRTMVAEWTAVVTIAILRDVVEAVGVGAAAAAAAAAVAAAAIAAASAAPVVATAAGLDSAKG